MKLDRYGLAVPRPQDEGVDRAYWQSRTLAGGDLPFRPLARLLGSDRGGKGFVKEWTESEIETLSLAARETEIVFTTEY